MAYRIKPGPTVGRVVHYVSYGTPGGEYGHECRAAIVTDVPEQNPGVPDEYPQVSLAVVNPTGMFFKTTVMFDGGDHGRHPNETTICDGRTHHGGTWHWPALAERIVE